MSIKESQLLSSIEKFLKESEEEPVINENRKTQLINFLETKGPAKRKFILQETGMPTDTLTHLLADKDKFCKAPGGLWKLRVRKRRNNVK